MPEDGFLFLGGAETVLGITDKFQMLPGQRGVYGVAAASASGARQPMPSFADRSRRRRAAVTDHEPQNEIAGRKPGDLRFWSDGGSA